MPPSVSIREYIRWLPSGPREEPTSTLVLTSTARRYVDIRILNPPPETSPDSESLIRTATEKDIKPLSHLSWAFAGNSHSTTAVPTPIRDQTSTFSIWHHFVDSLHPNAESVVDVGEILPHPDDHSLSLERGKMLNPSSGKEEEYEECWREIEAEPVEGEGEKGKGVGNVVIVLRDDESEQRGVVVRVGRWCQGIVRVGEGVSLERWAWEHEGGWRRGVRMGDFWMPCGLAMGAEGIKLGGEIRHGEQVWRVVELDEGSIGKGVDGALDS